MVIHPRPRIVKESRDPGPKCATIQASAHPGLDPIVAWKVVP